MVVAPQNASAGAARPPERGNPLSQRSPVRTILVVLVLTFLATELAARVASGSLPEPLVWSTPEMQYKVQQLEERDGSEVALVGSSVIDAGLDPAQVGGNVYNAALGAGSMRMIADFTRSVVVPRLDPDVVVVGVSARELNAFSAAVDEHERNFLAAPAVREALGTETVLDRLDRAMRDVSHLFRHRAALRDPGAWFSDDEGWDGRATGPDGFYLGFLDVPYRGGPEVRRNLAERAVPDFEIGERQLGELRALLTGLRDEDRRVVLTIGPVTRDFVEAFPGGAADHEHFVSVVTSMADEIGIELVTTGVWNSSLMADPVHTNAEGATRFSALIAEALRRG